MSENQQFYDGTKLLSLMDINGEKPEIYVCTTNRNGGKTTYFNRYVLRRFLNHGEKFCLVYRYNYELDDVSDKFFKDIKGLFFKEYHMKQVRKSDGVYCELWIGKELDDSDLKCCGYAISLNNADQIKKLSHMFSDVIRMLFDEFQSETNHYCDNEISKFISVHTSIARGQGEQVRYVPVIMVANTVSLINPYYVEWDISNRLNKDVNFMRCDGMVIENGFIASASEAQKQSGFNRAFKRNKYVAYASQSVYLNDNLSFIEKPEGFSKYLATIKYNDKEYAIREFRESGVLYCDDRPDKTYPYKISVTTDDHQINYVMLKQNDFFIKHLRYFFEKGCFRFRDLRSKEALLKCVSY